MTIGIIETSKGRFVVSDERYYLKNEFGIKTAYLNGVIQFEFEKFIDFSRITEEQASEIVDEDDEYGVRLYQNYDTTSMQYFDEQITAIESLHSLLKSKGIKITNNTYIFKI